MRDVKDITETELVRKYSPLVKAVARRYAGRGAEYEDLVQEGYLALLILFKKCRDKQWLAAYLAKRLPGYVRNAAKRLRGVGGRVPFIDIEECPEIILDPLHIDKEEWIEYIYIIKRILTPDDFIICRDLLCGCSQTDIAKKHKVTQQAISARLKKIRAVLEPVVKG